MADATPRLGALDHLGLVARAAAVDPAADSNVGARGSMHALADPGAAGLWLGERRFLAKLDLRGDPSDPAFAAGVRSVLGLAPPLKANTVAASGGVSLLWLGPDEFLAVADAGAEAALERKLIDVLAGHGHVTDVTESRTTIVVSGPRARNVLAKGCPIDLHPKMFKPGDCAQSLVARVGVILHRTDDGARGAPRFELHVLRSFADYLWRFLEDAGQEYGVAVVEV